METSDPRSWKRMSRGTGVLGLLLLVMVLVPTGQSPFFSNDSNAEIVSWVRQHPTNLFVEGFTTGLTMLLLSGFIGALLWRSVRRGPVVTVVVALLAGNVAVDILWGGAYYALAKAGQMHAPDAAVLALFAAVQEFTFTDGFLFGLAIAVVSVLALRHRTLPRPIAWLGLVCGIVHVLGVPVQLVLTGTVEGVMGPVSVVFFVLWLLATTLTVLVLPGRPTVLAPATPAALPDAMTA